MRVTFTKTVQLWQDGYHSDYEWDTETELWVKTTSSSGFHWEFPNIPFAMTDEEMMALALQSDDGVSKL